MSDLIGTMVLVLVNVSIIAMGWGDMRRHVRENRLRQDERHEENKELLGEIRDDVKRINGTVSEHIAILRNHADEIDRLRRKH